MFNLGLLGFLVTAIASAAAPSVWVLIGARTAQAAAAALVMSSPVLLNCSPSR